MSSSPLLTRRSALLARLDEDRLYDLAVVGGGASGLGVALDAAARGLSVVLLESHDFAKGTSSRATKLLHGGVRYLAQGRLRLVREALRERATVLGLAPHLAQPLSFVVPASGWLSWAWTGLGLKVYEWLSGRLSLGATVALSRQALTRCLPGLPQMVARSVGDTSRTWPRASSRWRAASRRRGRARRSRATVRPGPPAHAGPVRRRHPRVRARAAAGRRQPGQAWRAERTAWQPAPRAARRAARAPSRQRAASRARVPR